MSKNYDFRPTLPPQIPTPLQSGSIYQSPELTWCLSIISVRDSNSSAKILSATGSVAWHVDFTFSSITNKEVSLQGGRLTYSIALAMLAISS